MPFHDRSKDDPGDVGRAADQQESVDNDNFLKGIIEGDHIVRRIISKIGIADNVATEIFTITTINETGANDAGVWACKLHGAVVHGVAAEDEVELSVKGFGAQFCRAMDQDGVGACSAVTENLETAVADTNAAVKSIGAVTMTLVETSEYIISVRIQVDLTGTGVETAEVYFMVELAWAGFLTEPTIA